MSDRRGTIDVRLDPASNTVMGGSTPPRSPTSRLIMVEHSLHPPFDKIGGQLRPHGAKDWIWFQEYYPDPKGVKSAGWKLERAVEVIAAAGYPVINSGRKQYSIWVTFKSRLA